MIDMQNIIPPRPQTDIDPPIDFPLGKTLVEGTITNPDEPTSNVRFQFKTSFFVPIDCKADGKAELSCESAEEMKLISNGVQVQCGTVQNLLLSSESASELNIRIIRVDNSKDRVRTKVDRVELTDEAAMEDEEEMHNIMRTTISSGVEIVEEAEEAIEFIHITRCRQSSRPLAVAVGLNEMDTQPSDDTGESPDIPLEDGSSTQPHSSNVEESNLTPDFTSNVIFDGSNLENTSTNAITPMSTDIPSINVTDQSCCNWNGNWTPVNSSGAQTVSFICGQVPLQDCSNLVLSNIVSLNPVLSINEDEIRNRNQIIPRRTNNATKASFVHKTKKAPTRRSTFREIRPKDPNQSNTTSSSETFQLEPEQSNKPRKICAFCEQDYSFFYYSKHIKKCEKKAVADKLAAAENNKESSEPPTNPNDPKVLCHFCQEEFRGQRKVREHLDKFHFAKCRFCLMDFPFKSTLRSHIHRKHREEKRQYQMTSRIELEDKMDDKLENSTCDH